MENTIGERIKNLRENSGLTLEEVGKRIGASRQTIYKYENGIITNIPSNNIEGYKRLYENGKFTESEVAEEFNIKYHEENNPALMYLEDMTKEDFDGKPVKEIYDSYEDWCNDNSFSFSSRMLANTIEEEFGLTRGSLRINGKVAQGFKEK